MLIIHNYTLIDVDDANHIIKDPHLVINNDDKPPVCKVKNNDIPVCSICFNKFIFMGTKERKYIDNNGIKKVLKIRRLKCKHCNKTHNELPDFLVPKKRHARKTLQLAFSEPKEHL